MLTIFLQTKFTAFVIYSLKFNKIQDMIDIKYWELINNFAYKEVDEKWRLFFQFSVDFPCRRKRFYYWFSRALMNKLHLQSWVRLIIFARAKKMS